MRLRPPAPAGLELSRSSVNCVMKLGSIFSRQSKCRPSYSTIRAGANNIFFCSFAPATSICAFGGRQNSRQTCAPQGRPLPRAARPTAAPRLGGHWLKQTSFSGVSICLKAAQPKASPSTVQRVCRKSPEGARSRPLRLIGHRFAISEYPRQRLHGKQQPEH